LVQNTKFNNKKKCICNDLSNSPSLKYKNFGRQMCNLLSSITNCILILQCLLKQDDPKSKPGLHWIFQHLNRWPYNDTWFFHCAFLFLDFFVQVMVFCNDDWTSFKLTSKNLTHILTSSIAYWATLDMAWPKHEPTNGHASQREN